MHDHRLGQAGRQQVEKLLLFGRQYRYIGDPERRSAIIAFAGAAHRPQPGQPLAQRRGIFGRAGVELRRATRLCSDDRTWIDCARWYGYLVHRGHLSQNLYRLRSLWR
jgi:hypothetical protein